jgi:hypothetical protein
MLFVPPHCDPPPSKVGAPGMGLMITFTPLGLLSQFSFVVVTAVW